MEGIDVSQFGQVACPNFTSTVRTAIGHLDAARRRWHRQARPNIGTNRSLVSEVDRSRAEAF